MLSKKIGGLWSLPPFFRFIVVADERPATPSPPDLVSCFASGTNLLGHGLEPPKLGGNSNLFFFHFLS